VPYLRRYKKLSDYNGFWGVPNFKALKPFIGNWQFGIWNLELEIKKIGN
jgi:hypothetical protein